MGHHLETQDNRLSACSVKTLWKAKFSYWKLLNWFHPWPNMGFEYWKVGAFIHADMSCSLKKILNVYYLIFKKVGVYNSNSFPGGFSLVEDFFFLLKQQRIWIWELSPCLYWLVLLVLVVFPVLHPIWFDKMFSQKKIFRDFGSLVW